MDHSEWGAQYAVPPILRKIADSTALLSDSPLSLAFIVLLWITLHLSVAWWLTQGTSSQHGQQTTHPSLLEEEEVSAWLEWRAHVSEEAASSLRCDWWSPSNTNSLLTFMFHPGVLRVIFTGGHSRSSSTSAYSAPLKWGLAVHLPNEELKKKRKETISTKKQFSNGSFQNFLQRHV